MSELLRRWLRDDVGVTQHVDSFESAFASGFLFGEILARCNVQPDFAKFVNKNTPDARINNFTRLQVRRRGRLLRGLLLDAARPARGSRSRRRAARVPDETRASRHVGPTRETSFGSVNPRNIVRFPGFARLSRARSSPRRARTHAIPNHHPHIIFDDHQPSLQTLGVPLDARAVTSIVREERGVATRLLVQLKSVLDAMVRDVEQSKRAGVSALARSASLPTKPSLSVAQSHRGVGAFNSRLSTRRDADAKIFNDVVRARETRPNALMETSRVRAFLAEGERQKAEAAEAVRNRKIGISNRHADRRVEAVNAFNKTREAKAVRAASEYATHAEILRARADAERREIEIEMALEEKERLARVAREEREGEEALRGLDAFEKNLSRNAAGRKARQESSGTSGLGIPGGSRRDPREHLAAMRASLPDPRAMQREGERTIRRIKSDRSEEALARSAERRRRKLDAERERAGATAEARRREDELLATLAVKSKQETRVAERLSALERERDVMRDNRRDRDARYDAQRRADWERRSPRGEDGSAAARGLPRGRGGCGGGHRRRALRERARAPRGCPAVRGGRGARYRRAGVPLRGSTARRRRSSCRGASTASGPGCWWRASRSPSRCPRARRR